jgi:histidine triad (HIT) family protein
VPETASGDRLRARVSQEECIFCSIAVGAVPAQVIDEDEHTLTFMDINPWAPGHALVIPRTHARDLHEIDPDELGHVMRAAQRVSARMKERLGCEGVTLWNSAGIAAGQVIFHFHLHLIPRYASDGPAELRPRAHADQDDLAAVAAQLSD